MRKENIAIENKTKKKNMHIETIDIVRTCTCISYIKYGQSIFDINTWKYLS